MGNTREIAQVKGFGERLAHAIEKVAQTTRADLARKLSVKPTQISKWLSRSAAPESEDSIQRLATALNVAPAWLRYGTGAPRAEGEVDRAAVATGTTETPTSAEGLVGGRERVRAYLDGFGTGRAADGRRRDTLAALRLLFSVRGENPDWLYDLAPDVEERAVDLVALGGESPEDPEEFRRMATRRRLERAGFPSSPAADELPASAKDTRTDNRA